MPKKPHAAKDFRDDLRYYKGEDLFKVAWIGPTFSQGTENYTEKMKALERVFQEHNVIKELVDNWRDGLISEPFTWFLKDANGERVEAAEAEVQLQRWLDWVNQMALELDPTCTNFEQSSIWSEFILSLGVMGEGNLRLWQPARFAEDPDPIKRIHLHAPVVGSVTVDRDDDGFISKLTYSYGNDSHEVQVLQGETLSVQIANQEQPLELDTGGRWLIQQVRCPSLLTESAKRKQGAICHALTMMLRNQELGGFKERTLINAEFPEEEIERGPGIDQYLYGIPQGDPSNPTYATPVVHESQPVPVTTFVESVQINRTLLYLEFKQSHLLATNDAGLSGESRIQMRQGFELFLRGWKMPVESAIANIFNIVLKLLDYQDLEAVVSLNITTGKLSAEEREQVIKEFQAGLMSRSTAITKLGSVSDVDAEIELMEEERRQQTAPRQPSIEDVD